MNAEPTPLAARCRRAREAAGLSIGQAARALAVPNAVVANMEDDGPLAPVLRTHALAHMPGLYGVSANWLLTGKVSPEADRAASDLATTMTAKGIPADQQAKVLDLVRMLGAA